MGETREIFTLSNCVESFAAGAIRATPGMKDGSFALPMNFESVVNWVSDFMKRRFGSAKLANGDVFIFEATIEEVIGAMQTAADEHPAFNRWNDPPDHRPFLDLDAVWQNVKMSLRERLNSIPQVRA